MMFSYVPAYHICSKLYVAYWCFKTHNDDFVLKRWLISKIQFLKFELNCYRAQNFSKIWKIFSSFWSTFYLFLPLEWRLSLRFHIFVKQVKLTKKPVRDKLSLLFTPRGGDECQILWWLNTSLGKLPMLVFFLILSGPCAKIHNSVIDKIR